MSYLSLSNEDNIGIKDIKDIDIKVQTPKETFILLIQMITVQMCCGVRSLDRSASKFGPVPLTFRQEKSC